MKQEDIKIAIDQVRAGQAVLLDVRRLDEWQSGHAKGAILFPAERILLGGEAPDTSKDATIYTYCRSGGRAGRVRSALQHAGFTNVYNLGGLLDWSEAGGEVVKT